MQGYRGTAYEERKVTDNKKRFEVALETAASASSFLLSHENLRHEINRKGSNDYVTLADKKCEEIIINRILESFPDDAVLGEESGKRGDTESRWIIDPIDGTVDFMSSFPNYTVSIAYEDEEGIVFGVVSVPRQNEVFSAYRGDGAYLNGKRIYTDETTPLSETVAILVPPHRYHELLDGYMVKMRKFYEHVSDMRSLGSAAISLCYTAAGRVSMYYELGLHIYDIAAGVIILKEAGGSVSLSSDDDDWIDVAASASVYHDELLEIIND